MLEKQGKYYTELSNTITIFNDNNKSTFSKVNIQESILKVVVEDEEESIMDSNNVTADAFIHASSSQRENVGTIFTSEKLDKSYKIVGAINNLTINDARYELNKSTASDAQGNLPRFVSFRFVSFRIVSYRIVSFRFGMIRSTIGV